ncbi:hypothetical protein [Rhizobium acidisoli]|uniref:hypothetical protein n=1 Tax=Rhizobium acidisoli TaxID=1538158 RepID=UPI0006BA6823|nr:hypothetical protein [Rhizobium acidisoli]KPH06215.1 hypothetical protein AOG23_23585 [Rhizobium acidisoli]
MLSLPGSAGLLAAYLYGPMLFAYPLVYIATSPTIRLPTLDRLGDVSYGTYVYGWPVEQVMKPCPRPVQYVVGSLRPFFADKLIARLAFTASVGKACATVEANFIFQRQPVSALS